jgi:hypothetical protein
MSKGPILLTPAATNALVERLSRLPSVSQWDQPGEPQAATLAHSLMDLERSFRTTLDELLPKLLNEALTPEQLADVLLDIREELRHVLYHIRDPEFFGHVLDHGED